jgi:centromere protein C
MLSDLPLLGTRRKPESKVVGKAGQAFNIPNDENGKHVGYIMGSLVLPPTGIKDAESVGPCSQIFTVCACQPGALEVAFSNPDEHDGTLHPKTASRFLLNPHDVFRVPPENTYRLENHSTTKECFLTWVIIRPWQVSTNA